MDPQKFKGKTIANIIASFSRLEWRCIEGESSTEIPLGKITLVQYDTVKPVKQSDYLFRVKPNLVLAESLRQSEGKSLGLASIVAHEGLTHHIPMLDLDAHGKFDFFDDAQLLDMYKTTIKRETEIEQGLFLRSGPSRNYHFLGIGRLLTQDQYVTFLGLALTMKYEIGDNAINLADSRNIGHCLTRFAHKAELGKFPSRYCQFERFSTMRITPKQGYGGPPVVVDFIA